MSSGMILSGLRLLTASFNGEYSVPLIIFCNFARDDTLVIPKHQSALHGESFL